MVKTQTTTAQRPSDVAQAASDAAKAEKKQKKEKAKRVRYVDAAPDALKQEGLLIGVPTDFNAKQHKPPRKADFANESDYIEFAGTRQIARANAMREAGERLVAKAGELRKYGDSATRNRAAKADALIDRLVKMATELKGEGVDLDAKLAELMTKLRGAAN